MTTKTSVISKIAALTLLMLSAFSIANTDERWFQVEVILFKNPALETDNPEIWPTFANIDHPLSFIELTGIETEPESPEDAFFASQEQNNEAETAPAADGTLVPFQVLGEEEYKLADELAALTRGTRYELLYHQVWNQPVPDRNSVVPIHIQGGEKFGRQYELQGYISLYVERYLHLSTDLHLIEYQISNDPFSVIKDEEFQLPTLNLQSQNSFSNLLLNDDSPFSNQINQQTNEFYISVKDAQLKERRRMRSKEIHYLDNPEFGMLVLITPIEQ
ncbi:CsiV family protein [Reinekea marinisedimentorum]|uniref:Peptidoglycan-binding protein CsiV n=1 Tax=Reinekea marinisedimentorum TaxID=230495 RepID=A0A4R3IDA2_9GAMM|nr:CsiV family protein [Reinekea marinisedimentorum]TCS42635.1 peptidoglycan-binding protein CsiV [Reinekea marinisedimentorum]